MDWSAIINGCALAAISFLRMAVGRARAITGTGRPAEIEGTARGAGGHGIQVAFMRTASPAIPSAARTSAAIFS
jgi:hypothetical protein